MEKTRIRYYAAYGSNLNTHQMQLRYPGATAIGTSVIRNYELLFKGSLTGAYATIESMPDSLVPVGIWATTDSDEAQLDIYEGFPKFYYKTELLLPVTYWSGKTIKRNCYVYIMHEYREFGLPSTRYVHTVLQGYRDFHFNPHIIQTALTVTQSCMELN